MFKYIKDVIVDPNTNSPSSHRFVSVIASICLCLGFLVSTICLLSGVVVSESIILGLGGIVATLAGANYATNKFSKTDKTEQK